MSRPIVHIFLVIFILGLLAAWLGSASPVAASTVATAELSEIPNTNIIPLALLCVALLAALLHLALRRADSQHHGSSSGSHSALSRPSALRPLDAASRQLGADFRHALVHLPRVAAHPQLDVAAHAVAAE